MKIRALVTGALAALVSASAVAADVFTYNVTLLADNSGPFADLSKRLAARSAVIQWWNDNEGKKLGVKLNSKTYDTRYDPSVVASIWPGIVSSEKPIVGLGLGGPDVSALQERLPDDKVPVIYSTPGYGYSWTPNSWVFNLRPSYVHEYLGVLNWFIEKNPEKRPVKIAFISTQQSPAFVDMVRGITKYVDDNLKPKNLAEIVATEWVPIQPVDLGSQIQRINAAGADLIFGVANTAMASAAVRAGQLHGVNIPTVASSWHTIWPVGQAMKSYKAWEGHYVATGIVPIADNNGAAHAFYQELASKYDLPKTWDPLTLLGMSQGIVAVKAIEATAKRVGADKLTGQAVYETLTTHKFQEAELQGFMKGLGYTKDAPFPLSGWIKIVTVKDGEYTLADPEWVPIPEDVVKW